MGESVRVDGQVQQLPAGNPHPILAIRVEWAWPAGLEAAELRALRDYVTKALDDVGYSDAVLYRRDGSAGTTVAIEATAERPGLTAGVFLSTLDDEHRGRDTKLRFLAHLADPAIYSNGLPKIEEAVADVELFCSSPELRAHWPTGPEPLRQRSKPVSAVVHGIDLRNATDFWGGWTPKCLPMSQPFRGIYVGDAGWLNPRAKRMEPVSPVRHSVARYFETPDALRPCLRHRSRWCTGIVVEHRWADP